MTVKRLEFGNREPLLKLLAHPYQMRFMEARRLRACVRGHEWHDPHQKSCPQCGGLGLRGYTSLILRAGRRGGKALDINTPIPTPRGWTTMGDLRVGDRVFDADGYATAVTYCSPVYLGHECYELTFSDGSRLVADADHQWEVLPKSARKHGHATTRVLTTREIAGTLLTHQGESAYAIPAAGALEYPEAALPVQPYTLGAWLGDGSSAAAELCCHENSVQILDEILRDGYAIGLPRRVKSRTPMYTIGFVGHSRDRRTGRLTANTSLHTTLRLSGLLHNKHIPETYFLGSIAQRLALVQGLMDTDGYVTRDGSCEFDSTNPRIATGMLRLLRSLGVIARLHTGTAKLRGIPTGSPKYRVSWNDPLPVCRLERKARRLRARTAYRPQTRLRYITAALPVQSRAVKCIQVANSRALYLAGEACIPTHNTRIGALAAIDELSVPGTVGWCCAPTYPKLHDYVLPAFFAQMPQTWLDHPDTSWSESNLELILPNKSLVQFRSLEDVDAGRGPGLNFAWVDEICELTLEHWDVLSPALADRGGAVFATTSPRGEDWVHETFYEPAERGEPGFWACSFPTSENPWMQQPAQKVAIERARRTMSPLMFRQEYLAEIVSFTGAIYGESLTPCVIAGTDDEMRQYFPEWPLINPSRPSVTGLDPGTDHPFAGVHLVASPRGLVAVGEYEERGLVYALHAMNIQKLRRGSQSRIGIDRSQAQAQLELAQYQIFATRAENDVVGGINRVSAWMLKTALAPRHNDLPQGGLILPRALVPRLIKALQAYRWDDSTKRDGSTQRREKVFKKNDDLPDALRYALMTYPTLPESDPEVVLNPVRDLSGLPDHVRLEIERERRSMGAYSRTATGLFDEDVEGMGDFARTYPD